MLSSILDALPTREAKERRRLKRQIEAGRSALPSPMINGIQRGIENLQYKGHRILKDPFDFAIYSTLLWREKPATIVEIGSCEGGSALWMADLMRSYEIPCAIHSVDINKVTGVTAPGVMFHQGDAHNLGALFDDRFMAGITRPLLVIEDADHVKGTTLAVLRFFDKWLRPGEYIIVEDSIVTDMGIAGQFDGGPLGAIDEFLAERGADYEIDRFYCDMFGQNLTWNVNGYLKRVR